MTFKNEFWCINFVLVQSKVFLVFVAFMNFDYYFKTIYDFVAGLWWSEGVTQRTTNLRISLTLVPINVAEPNLKETRHKTESRVPRVI